MFLLLGEIAMNSQFRLLSGVTTVLTLGILAGFVAAAGEDKAAKASVDAKTAFAKIKTLVGEWKSEISGGHGAKEAGHPEEAVVTYRLTGAGSALIETQFPGTGHEMVTVYHLDGDDLRMTHYCAAGNQPRMKLDRANSTADHLIFLFDGGSNLDPQKDMHIHGLEIRFEKDGHVKSAWEGYSDGKSAGVTAFAMVRK
jgi:hypothetical protein